MADEETVGWTLDGGAFLAPEAEEPFLRAPLTTLYASQQWAVSDVDPEALRIVMGIDVARDSVAAPTYGVQVTQHLCPFTTPHKRKGLTGKRYRIARRQWARKVKAWRRGLVPDLLVTHYYAPVAIDAIPGDPGAYSIGFRGVSASHVVLDEAAGLSTEH